MKVYGIARQWNKGVATYTRTFTSVEKLFEAVVKDEKVDTSNSVYNYKLGKELDTIGAIEVYYRRAYCGSICYWISEVE